MINIEVRSTINKKRKKLKIIKWRGGKKQEKKDKEMMKKLI